MIRAEAKKTAGVTLEGGVKGGVGFASIGGSKGLMMLIAVAIILFFVLGKKETYVYHFK